MSVMNPEYRRESGASTIRAELHEQDVLGPVSGAALMETSVRQVEPGDIVLLN